MGYNSVDIIDYVSELSRLTKIDKKNIYVIVMKNFQKINNGLQTISEAYLNISIELANIKETNDSLCYYKTY